MLLLSSADKDRVASLIGDCRPWTGLPQAFYTSDQMHRVDLVRIWHRNWLFAGHTCDIPEPGDYFTYGVGDDSVIVIRGDQGEVKAHFNTCRHRGSRICIQEQGHAGKLVCPYHQWVYDRGGSLVSCGGMDTETDTASLGLHEAQVRVVAGLIYIGLSKDMPDFAPAESEIAPHLEPHGLADAKIAHQIDYTVNANWKLVFENNRECYHCQANHPEFCRATFDTRREHEGAQNEISRRIEETLPMLEAAGIDVSAMTASSEMSGDWYRASRSPLVEEFVTESLDGQPVAPPMGAFDTVDVGTCRITTFPNFWSHASGDHAVTTRLTPLSAGQTQVRVYWLVNRDAVEGTDYQLDRLLPFWQRTSEQDWELAENNHLGISSSRYTPGPYSKKKEANVEQFVRWYLGELEASDQ